MSGLGHCCLVNLISKTRWIAASLLKHWHSQHNWLLARIGSALLCLPWTTCSPKWAAPILQPPYALWLCTSLQCPKTVILSPGNYHLLLCPCLQAARENSSATAPPTLWSCVKSDLPMQLQFVLNTWMLGFQHNTASSRKLLIHWQNRL